MLNPDLANSQTSEIPSGDRESCQRSAIAKRCMDVTLGGLLLIVALPIMTIVTAYILLMSGRPVLFRQTRVGRLGNTFTMLKFRTMVPDAESLSDGLIDERPHSGEQASSFKLTEDPRVFRGGAVLRRWSLDELPQLINVVGGSMSLVGPRPHTLRDFAAYQEATFERLQVLPGMSGPWQIGGRCELSGDESLALDLEYVRHGSIVIDTAILLRTVGAVVSGRGAM